MRCAAAINIHALLALHISEPRDSGNHVISLRSSWRQVLFPEAVATQLAAVHTHIAAAYTPRHQQGALQSLRAMFAVLGPRVCILPTLRYAVHIVLQLIATM